MDLRYTKEDCNVCNNKGQILVKIADKQRPRKENCPLCNGRRKLTILKKER